MGPAAPCGLVHRFAILPDVIDAASLGIVGHERNPGTARSRPADRRADGVFPGRAVDAGVFPECGDPARLGTCGTRAAAARRPGWVRRGACGSVRAAWLPAREGQALARDDPPPPLTRTSAPPPGRSAHASAQAIPLAK